MSTPLTPNTYSYASWPLTCDPIWGIGQSPDTIFAHISGVEPGDLWSPSDGPPPNGVYPLHPTAECTYYGSTSGVDLYLVYNGIPTSLIIDTPTVTNAYWGPAFPANPLWLPNQQTNPAAYKFVGGVAAIFSTLSCTRPNLEDLWASLAESYEPETYATARPAADEKTALTISRRRDATNIHILLDIS